MPAPFEVTKVRPTPFSELYPESYIALAGIHPDLQLTPEYWKRQFLNVRSKRAKDHAKIRFLETSTAESPIAELNKLEE